MKLSAFDYPLSRHHIAQYPAMKRDSSRLLVLKRKNRRREHRIFNNIAEYFRAGDTLIINDTRVIPARLYGKKPSGGKVEVLLLREIHANTWLARVRGVQHGQVVFNNGISGSVSRNNGSTTIIFNHEAKKFLHKIGLMPLPPYIKRPAEKSDEVRYQTVYAEKNGSVAAPTAGLHFTEKILDGIQRKGVCIGKITLHVGYGTFKPVLCNEIENHHMDEEYYEIPEYTVDIINQTKSRGGRVIAVGTTVTRALETSAKSTGENTVQSGSGSSDIFIHPGYKFRVIDALITNFHLPKSAPFILTSSFSGLPLLKKAYHDALSRDYRFYSYGDAMFII
jgi:S-adenosylmethionine:tRNA ribosyltransferase-isomerase